MRAFVFCSLDGWHPWEALERVPPGINIIRFSTEGIGGKGNAFGEKKVLKVQV